MKLVICTFAEEEHSKQKEKKEAPAKLLDDLFRKTKATPCIYWLPLTKDQVKWIYFQYINNLRTHVPSRIGTGLI